MDSNRIGKNIQYLQGVNIGLSDKLDKVVNPKLCSSDLPEIDNTPDERVASPYYRPKLWITRVKTTSKIQSKTPKGGSKELIGQLLNKEGQSLLHQASFYGKISVIQKLVKVGADVNQEDWGGTTPLLYAIKGCQVEAVRELLKSPGLKICEKFGHRHETALIKAVKLGHTEIVKEICQSRRECIGKVDVEGRSPLFYAITKGCSQIVSCLVLAGSREKELIDYKGSNAIYIAMEQGEVGSIETLLKFNEFRVSEAIYEKLLIMACYGNKRTLIKIILPHLSLSGNVRDQGLSPMLISYQLGFREITLMLLDNYLNNEVDYVSPQGMFLLMAACLKNDLELVKVLLNRDCNIELTDSLGKTALHVVCEKGFAECLDCILMKHGKINPLDHRGFTPACLAAALNQPETLKIILARGGDIPKNTVESIKKSATSVILNILDQYSKAKRGRKDRYINKKFYENR